jgi:uncharacterized protein (DUF58 family)
MQGIWQKMVAGIKRWVREPRVIWRRESSHFQFSIEIQHWLPFAVVITLLAWYIADPTPVATMSLVALTGVLIADYWWARTMALGVMGHRRLRFVAMQVGDELEEVISLTNATMLPVMWVEFRDHSNIPGYTVSSVRGADPSSQAQWRAHTICTRRGVFSLGPWELLLGQPFGIFLVHQIYLQRQEILVYPPMAVLPEQVLPHYGSMGDHRPLNQPLRAETISSTTVRAYQPGDPLRNIHWPTTARRSDPFVKVFAPEAASQVWLVPDFDRSVQRGEGEDSSEEMMVTITASLAAVLLEQKLSVGLLASAGEDVYVLPRQGQTHLWTILQTLAPLHSTGGSSLADVLERARALISGSDLLIVVTPSIQPDWVLPLQYLARSRGGGGRAEVILLNQDSKESEDRVNAFLPLLLERGIRANIVGKDNIQLISGYYGEINRWEFIVSGTGRAVARNMPRAAAQVMPGNNQIGRRPDGRGG